jgi:shikimate dehydrogenase
LGYKDITPEIMAENTIIVNCTPLGIYPDTNACPSIPYEYISARHLLFDCIYNPAETLFLQNGKAHGATIRNGLEMLHGQAKEAWKIWNGER